MNFDEEIRDFLIESNENLANLDSAIVLLEQSPDDPQLISSVFRTIHTIKGTCGFFGFDILGSVTHVAENILDQVRDQQRKLTPALISLILEAVDVVKQLLARIESTGSEGDDHTGPLRARLEAAQADCTNALGEKLPPSERVVFIDSVPAAPEPAAASAPSEKESGKEAPLADSTIRVDVGLLNRLMNMVGELVLARNQLLQNAPAQTPAVQKTLQRLNLITSELQESLMKTRMQPVGVVWNKLPRVVRDLAAKCGKTIQIQMEGTNTELDKTIIEAIKDPLTHIVRNSCDHGIELPEIRLAKGKSAAGNIILRAYHEGGVVNLEISDDGAGLDPNRLKAKAVEKGLLRPDEAAAMNTRDALHLIFMAGFSTAAAVTSISGRGVGMDVVKTNIENIGGTVEVMNGAEGGATIRIQIPLTLAIIPGLVVTLENGQDEQDSRFIIPQANLLELVRLEGPAEMNRIDNVHSTPIFHHRGKLLPLIYLGKVLGALDFEATREVVNIVVLQAEKRQIGLVVDSICDTQEIVVKPLGRQLKILTCYVGATIMGDGRPALILDVVGLSRLAGLGLHSRTTMLDQTQQQPEAQPSQMFLLFCAGRHQRLAVPLSLVDRLEEVDTSRIESAAGQPVLNYCGEILPLIALSSVLNPGEGGQDLDQPVSQLIVFTSGGRRIGMVVERILDIVSETVTVRRSSRAHGLLGSVVIGGRITDLLDLNTLIQQLGEDWLLAQAPQGAESPCLLLLDPTPVAREMVANYLEMQGFQVVQAATAAEALMRTRQVTVDAVLSAVDLGNPLGAELFLSLQRVNQPQPVPLLGLLDRETQRRPTAPAGNHFSAHLLRADRPSLLRVLQQQLNAPILQAEVA